MPVLLTVSLMPPVRAGSGLVADPFRAVYQTWKTHPVAGRDFWLLLDPRWLSLKGLENEAFIQESGTGFVDLPMNCENLTPMRVVSIHSVRCFDPAGKEQKADVPRSRRAHCSLLHRAIISF